MKVLNVGGGTGNVLPSNFNGYEQVLLDIDPAVNPDICLDALELKTLEAEQFDAIFCSHNLEHFYHHEVPTVLAGFLHVLKPGGFAQIHVPNIKGMLEVMQERDLDIHDVYYRVGVHPITFHDVMFGWGAQVSNGNKYYSHKTAFTLISLNTALQTAGFVEIGLHKDTSELIARGFKCQ